MSNEETIFPFAATHHIRDACLCLHAQRAARSLGRRFDEALRPIGLTSGQFSLLNALNRPAPPSMAPVAAPPSMAPVAALLGMDRTTLTAALKPLQRRGLVAVEPDANDRRGRRLRLTAEGSALLARAAPVWMRTHAEVEARLGGRVDALRAALRDLA
jgi:DNA-binding MarR family transcriptional regulator